jgi:hypothetical protein
MQFGNREERDYQPLETVTEGLVKKLLTRMAKFVL